MTTGERIRELRNELSLTQTEFGQRIGVSQNHLTGLETNKRNVTERIEKLICSEFSVSEAWLRTGEGEMFIQTADSAIDRLVQEMNLDEIDKKILSVYIGLPPQHRAVLKSYLVDLVRELAPVPQEREQLTIDEEVEAYRAELEAERKGGTSSPSDASGA